MSKRSTATNLRIRRPRVNKKFYRLGLAAAIVLAVGFFAVRFLGVGQPTILITTKTLAVGDQLSAENTKSISIDDDDLAGKYLVELGQAPLVATSPIGPGELVPERLVTQSKLVGLVSVNLTLSNSVSSQVHAGNFVDLWSAGSSGFGDATPPRMLAAQAIVRQVQTSTVLGKTVASLELAIDPAYLDSVLAAQAAEDFITVVAST